ncbi:hypothetical protein [Luedemannella flava]|uniref:hypothetical protein n=1 Tax=Luedemannella flava TaxID=349316 RepID=UPI0031D05D8B
MVGLPVVVVLVVLCAQTAGPYLADVARCPPPIECFGEGPDIPPLLIHNETGAELFFRRLDEPLAGTVSVPGRSVTDIGHFVHPCDATVVLLARDWSGTELACLAGTACDTRTWQFAADGAVVATSG